MLAAYLATCASAHAEETVRFTLNWRYEGPNAPFFLAEDKGYFAAEGLKVVLDQGEGSSAVVSRIASGTYDAGFGDINTMIEFNARFPDRGEKAVYVLYNRPPMAIISLAKSGIAKPSDLEGRKVGAPTNDTGYRMFPALAKAAGINAAKIQFQSVDPTLREPMLIKGDVDAVTGFDSTSWFALKGLGVKREDVRLLYYADFGIDVYSNSIIVSRDMVEKRPNVVEGLIRAINRGWVDTIKDPKAAIAALVKRDSLVKPDLELERLQWVIDNQIVTAESRANGIGAADPARLERAIDLIAGSFGLPRKPSVQEVYTDRFLPPRSARSLPN